MLIRCVACRKLFYFDDAPRDDRCPACGSEHTDEIAMSIVFERAGGDVESPPPVRSSPPIPPRR